MLCSSTIFGQTTIWFEGFETYGDNATTPQNNNTANASNDWYLTDGSSNNTDKWRVEDDYGSITGNRLFAGEDTDGQVIWTTEVIDISSFTNILAKPC